MDSRMYFALSDLDLIDFDETPVSGSPGVSSISVRFPSLGKMVETKCFIVSEKQYDLIKKLKKGAVPAECDNYDKYVGSAILSAMVEACRSLTAHDKMALYAVIGEANATV